MCQQTLVRLWVAFVRVCVWEGFVCLSVLRTCRLGLFYEGKLYSVG